jgi:UDP-glucuronate 4-epimerase
LEKNCGKPAKITMVGLQKGDVQDTLADIQKAQAVLGWRPRVAIREGVKTYVEWFIQNNC